MCWDNFREVLLEKERFLVSSLSLLCENCRLRQDFSGIRRAELLRTASETEASKPSVTEYRKNTFGFEIFTWMGHR
jgi:hypothetical protein